MLSKPLKEFWSPIPSESVIEATQGFIYKITNKSTGEFYIGKKSWRVRRKLKPLKGKKRARIQYKENWQQYRSSSTELKTRIKQNPDDWYGEIIAVCENKISLSYWENYFLYTEHALLDPKCLNGNISGKFYRNKIQKYKKL